MARILIVDDEANVRFALKHVLSRSFEVSGADNAENAMDLLEKERFDVVLADLNLTGRDGLWLLARVRERWPATRRVLISGQAGVCESLLMSSDIAHAFLAKPATFEELSAAITADGDDPALAPAS